MNVIAKMFSVLESILEVLSDGYIQICRINQYDKNLAKKHEKNREKNSFLHFSGSKIIFFQNVIIVFESSLHELLNGVFTFSNLLIDMEIFSKNLKKVTFTKTRISWKSLIRSIPNFDT